MLLRAPTAHVSQTGLCVGAVSELLDATATLLHVMQAAPGFAAALACNGAATSALIRVLHSLLHRCAAVGGASSAVVVTVCGGVGGWVGARCRCR